MLHALLARMTFEPYLNSCKFHPPKKKLKTKTKPTNCPDLWSKVWKDLNDAEYRRHFYMRERSYASEPGSRILLKLDDEKEKIVPDLGLASDHDEDDDTIECDLGMRTSTLSEPLDFGRRSQTLLEVVSLWSRDTCISYL